MPLLSLEDEVRSEIAHILDPSRPVFFRFSFEEVKAGHRPGWPLAYSFILHELAIIAVVLLSIVTSRFHPIKDAENLKLNPTHHVVYLPVHARGSAGNGHEGGLSGDVEPKCAPAPAPPSKHPTYRGPHRIP